MKVGIIGLGLIGGSLAKSIKTRTQHVVAAIDLNPETMMFARLCGAIDEPLTDDNLGTCELILTAIRPQATIDWVLAHGACISSQTILVDMCGVKRAVCAAIAPLAERFGFSYIGGHPMAGRERGGFVNSSDNLFAGAPMILTPDERTDMKMLEKLKAFFTDIGFSGLTFTTPDEHDRMIAYTSQLAHLTSSAYIRSPDAQRRRGFSAGSFQDMTRVARLDEDMWTELMMANSDYLTDQLELLVGHLSEYLEALRDGDAETLCALLRDGREKKITSGGN
ncbi:MAG: prephenate dehydrogenase/arogenate dehydrogenase family protein [Clostridiaceae bacterium]|nr:prephenate dehydrogenase/arogenate dehydrogenase family protein [Clostridiaceae bacterium]